MKSDPSKINVFEGNLISSLYEKESNKFLTKKSEKFSCIILNVIDQELNIAWEKAWEDEIENYKIKEESIEKCVNVVKKELMKTTPELLIFQMNRVKYTEKFEAVKINDNFLFETEIFIDKFLEKNSEIYMKSQNELKKIDSEIFNLTEQKKRFDNFSGEKQSVIGNYFRFYFLIKSKFPNCD